MAVVIYVPHNDIPVVLRNNVVIDMAITCIRGIIWSHIMIKNILAPFSIINVNEKMAFGHAVRIKKILKFGIKIFLIYEYLLIADAWYIHYCLN